MFNVCGKYTILQVNRGILLSVYDLVVKIYTMPEEVEILLVKAII